MKKVSDFIILFQAFNHDCMCCYVHPTQSIVREHIKEWCQRGRILAYPECVQVGNYYWEWQWKCLRIDVLFYIVPSIRLILRERPSIWQIQLIILTCGHIISWHLDIIMPLMTMWYLGLDSSCRISRHDLINFELRCSIFWYMRQISRQ